MIISIFGVCDVGRIREHNEDKILIGDYFFYNTSYSTQIEITPNNYKYFVAIADGMGGHNAGEVASEIALSMFSEKLKYIGNNLNYDLVKDYFYDISHQIHNYINQKGMEKLDRKGMGTTLVGLFIYNDNLYYINVGDSRLYRYRDGYLNQISRDHSLRNLTKNTNTPKNIITSSFGGGNNITIDFGVASKLIIDNDIFLLCSDGLWEKISDEEIENIIKNESKPIDVLLSIAKESGGDDNISIILLKINK